MRSALLLLASVLALGTGLASCGHGTCTSANGANPVGDVRFVGVASSGNAAQLVLLGTTIAIDHDGHHVLDAHGGDILTVQRIGDFAASTTAQSWLDNHSDWSVGTRNMLGRGIGTSPIVPPAPPAGPFVAIGGASSVVRFPLGPEETTDAGMPPGDAGLSPQHAHEWEWLWPRTTTDLPSDATPPTLADLVVVPSFAPDHDVAFVARTASSSGGQLFGGELFVLDIDDPAHVTRLTTLTFDAYADAGLHAVPSALAYADGLVFVVLDHQSFTAPASLVGPGLVAVIDARARTLRTVLRLPSFTNCARIAPYHPPTRTAIDPEDSGETHRIVVSCMGSAPTTPGVAQSDSGFAYLEYEGAPAIAQTISAASLSVARADAAVMPLYGHWVAVVSHGSTTAPVTPDRIIAANLASGATQILATAPSGNGTALFGFGEGAFDPGSGVLVVPNGFDGVLTWQLPSAYGALEGPSGYTFEPAFATTITSCGHLPTRHVRAVGGGGAAVIPTPDAGMPHDAATATDAATSSDAGVDVGP